ncbi:LysR substrate-binding domain-containing protein [Dactylosporangium salmoneum]|uniref:LysR substrate-binding domain-containing protein n=1 Tax=Dactylosporangium salmoneum TaxID=53361 RepID=A0ABN3HFK6_9ACTN
MHSIRDGDLGTLRAGVPPETPAAALGELLRRLGEQAPGLDVDLQELTTAEQLDLLAAARLDVGLVHHPVGAADLRRARSPGRASASCCPASRRWPGSPSSPSTSSPGRASSCFRARTP